MKDFKAPKELLEARARKQADKNKTLSDKQKVDILWEEYLRG